MNGDPENRSESGSEEEEHRHRQLTNGIKNQRITKAQDRILNRMPLVGGLAGGSCRGDADGVSPAQGTSPADEVHEHAGAVQRGDSPARTRVVRLFPNVESCLRLILVLAAETHERWLTGQRYLYGQIGVVRASEPESEAWQAAA